MESDAFKIPLRFNPSTLPNVFPTILLVQSQAFKTNRKAFLLSLFKKACLIWSIHIMSQEMDKSYWLSRCGQAEWFSLLTQLSRERIKGLASARTHVLLLSLCLTKAVTLAQNCVTDSWVSPSSILHHCGALTQACIVWSFINSVSAAGICGGLWHLDPNREMATFSICLTPPASKTAIYWDTLLVKAHKTPLRWYFIKSMH